MGHIETSKINVPWVEVGVESPCPMCDGTSRCVTYKGVGAPLCGCYNVKNKYGLKVKDYKRGTLWIYAPVGVARTRKGVA